MEQHEINFFAGRLSATRRTDWMTPTLFAMSLHWSTEVTSGDKPTMGVDRNCRIYVHPQACLDWGVAEIAATIVHEAWHINLDHCGRADDYRKSEGDAFDHERWNIAVDMVVNPCTRDLGFDMPAEQGWVFPSTYGYEEGLTADEYYRKLKEDDKGGGGGKEGEPGSGKGKGRHDPNAQGGSCGDGVPREYESKDPSDALSASEKRGLAKACAEAFKNSNSRGNTSADWVRAVEELTEPPKVMWQNMLQGAISQGVIRAQGKDEYSYHAPHRLSSMPNMDLVRPVMCSYLPKVATVIDESGSMGQGKGSRRHAAHTELKGILDHEQAAVKVVTFDTEANDSGFVESLDEVEFKGGGGTDVRIPLDYLTKQYEDAEERVDVAIVLTDCETPWPDKEPPYDVIVVDCREGDGYGSVPEWAEHIKVTDD